MSLHNPLPPQKNKQLLLYILMLIAAVTLMLSLHTCNMQTNRTKQNSTKKHTSTDTLVIALIYGPMNYYIHADTLGGFCYDMLKEISRTENTPITFRPVNDLHEGVRLLKNDNYDLLATLPQETAYTQQLSYSTPVFLDCQVLIQKKDTGGKPAVKSAHDLAGKTIHIEKNNPALNKIKHLSHEIGDTINIIEHSGLSSETLAAKIENGQIQYAIINEQTALSVTANNTSLDISSPIRFTQLQCIAASPADSALIRKVNKWLNNATTNQTIKKLRSRYNAIP